MIFKKNVFQFKDAQKGIFPFQINSLVCKNFYKNKKLDNKMIYEIDRLMCDRILALLTLETGDIYILKDVLGCYRVCINRYNKTVFEDIINMLNVVSNLQKRKFIHNNANFDYYIASLIFDYYILSLISHQKIKKQERQRIMSYFKFKYILYVPSTIFRYVLSFIKNIKLKLIGKSDTNE